MNQQAAAAAPTTRLQARVLALLLLAYVFNFLDRQILSILAIPIQAELKLTNEQLGLMGGIAFAALYSTFAIPIARFADRGRRVATISTAVAVWSAFTALCGAAGNFWQLFLARMGVGIGEAGGVAPSYALISDYFPPSQRARALAIFSLGIPIGSALGLFFGGWIATALNWRWAFVLIGLAGIPIAIALRRLVPEPTLGALDAAPEAGASVNPSFGEVFATLARKPSFWLLSFGAASGSICGYGFGFWLPKYMTARLELPLDQLGLYFGVIVLVGGSLGIWLGGLMGDKLGGARPGAYALVPGIAFLLAAPLYVVALRNESLALGLILYTIPYMLSLAWLGPIVNAVQNLVPPTMRGTASACMLLINNLIGIGFGIYFFGAMTDRLTPEYGDAALYQALFIGLGFYILGGLLFLAASRTLKRDWYLRTPD
ncbi:MFS transporter [Sphingomonas sp. LY29]|uniref:spinster family MFS transporter n=1 Tax=Sphingomonas sp. LY29 TaxID=3095341 RepID=UPI002D78BC3D|nr:MFS transporter [Sphingomonas sp. LY29]WRP24982.1 MFS transporter [Sphingomonas sp. LY29]